MVAILFHNFKRGNHESHESSRIRRARGSHTPEEIKDVRNHCFGIWVDRKPRCHSLGRRAYRSPRRPHGDNGSHSSFRPVGPTQDPRPNTFDFPQDGSTHGGPVASRKHTAPFGGESNPQLNDRSECGHSHYGWKPQQPSPQSPGKLVLKSVDVAL